MSETGDIVIIDTSPVIAILKREPEADNLIERIARNQPQMSAGTQAVLLIVDE